MPSAKPRRQRGEGGLYRRANGLYVGSVEVPQPDGTRKRKYVARKRQADALAELTKLKRQIAEHGALPDQRVTVERWLTYWLEHIAGPRNRPRTVESYRSIVNRHLIPHLGRKRLDQLAPAHVRVMLEDLGRATDDRTALSPAMVLKVHRTLGKALTDAMREGQVTRNVARLVGAPRQGSRRDRGAYTIDQAATLLRAMAAHPDAARWATALILGPRPGEVLGLQIDRVDLDAAEVRIDRQLQRVPYRHGCGTPAGKVWPCGRRFGGDCPRRELAVPRGFDCVQIDGSLCLTPPKSDTGVRVAPLTRALVDLYREQIRRQAGRPNPHGLMWTRDDGRPLDPKEDRKAWADLVAAAGLPPLDLYAARHTFVTLMLADGEDVKVVGEVVGHTDPRTTRGYQHVSSGVARAAIERLSARLEAG